MKKGRYFRALLSVPQMKRSHHHYHNSGVCSTRGEGTASRSAVFFLQSPNKNTYKRDLFVLLKAALTLPRRSVTPPDGSQYTDAGTQPLPAEPPRAMQETKKKSTE